MNDCLCQTPRHAGIAIQPTDSLHAFATITAADPPEQHAEAYRTTENRQIANGTLAILMRGWTGFLAVATGRELGGVGNQIDLESVAIRLDRDDRKALPKRKESINIAHKNAGLLDVFVRTNIINQIGVLVSVFPRIP